MKTLLIHPEDASTDSLILSYQFLGFTVINNNKISKSNLRRLIKEHDRIIMMGHGTGKGLFGDEGRRLLIDASLVQLLREKECICIWCYANEFVEKYKLNASLYTGMIISESGEAYYCSISNFKTKDIDDSNISFSNFLRNYFEKGIFDLSLYYDKDNPIINYNRYNIYQKNLTETHCLQF